MKRRHGWRTIMLRAAFRPPATTLCIPRARDAISQWRLAGWLWVRLALLVLPPTVHKLLPRVPCLVSLAIQVVVATKDRVVTLRRVHRRKLRAVRLHLVERAGVRLEAPCVSIVYKKDAR